MFQELTSTSTKFDAISDIIDRDVWNAMLSSRFVDVVLTVGGTEIGYCDKVLYTIKWNPERFWNQIRLAAIRAQNISIPKKENLPKLGKGAHWWVNVNITVWYICKMSRLNNVRNMLWCDYMLLFCLDRGNMAFSLDWNRTKICIWMCDFSKLPTQTFFWNARSTKFERRWRIN